MSRDRNTGYVFDSFAVMAWLKGSEPSASIVNDILLSGDPVAMSAINLGEIIYTLQKRFGGDHSERFLKRLPNLPLEIVTPNFPDILEAAQLKARFAIAYAEAFAAQLAFKRAAPLVTGDPELRAIAELKFLWLGADTT